MSAACCWSSLRCGDFPGAFIVLAQSLFPARLNEVMSGNDPSFFYRVQGPALAGLDVISRYPFAGTGLTGEPFFEREVTNLYLRSPFYSAHWQVVTPATELVINYFWLHWIYLGLIWGLIMAGAITIWLRVLGVPSPAFCWMVWAILGQASGAYVGPTCWAVLFLAAAAAVAAPATAARRRRGPHPTTLHYARSLPRSGVASVFEGVFQRAQAGPLGRHQHRHVAGLVLVLPHLGVGAWECRPSRRPRSCRDRCGARSPAGWPGSPAAGWRSGCPGCASGASTRSGRPW